MQFAKVFSGTKIYETGFADPFLTESLRNKGNTQTNVLFKNIHLYVMYR